MVSLTPFAVVPMLSFDVARYGFPSFCKTAISCLRLYLVLSMLITAVRFSTVLFSDNTNLMSLLPLLPFVFEAVIHCQFSVLSICQEQYEFTLIVCSPPMDSISISSVDTKRASAGSNPSTALLHDANKIANTNVQYDIYLFM